MKSKKLFYSTPKALTAAVLVLQFITVQVQASYGNTQLANFSPEHQQAVRGVKQRIASLLESKTEEQKVNLAYSLYRLGVKARNQVAGWSESKFERRLTAAFNKKLSHENMNADESAMVSDIESNADLKEISTQFVGMQSEQTSTTTLANSVESKSTLLERLDPVLVSLGSDMNAKGKLNIASKEAFVKAGLETVKTQELRAPASLADLLVDLLTLIIFAVCIILVIYLALTIVSVLLSPVFWLCMVIFMCSGGFWIVVRVR